MQLACNVNQSAIKRSFMKAYRIHSPHSLQLDEMDALSVGDNCVKLKNLICGISATDVLAYTGAIPAKYPVIPVRQCVGFVSEVGANVSGLARGNRVITYPQACCHNCRPCKDSRFFDCDRPLAFGLEEDGFLSDFSVVSADNVYSIPDRLKDEEAVFVEHTALAINVMSKLGVEKGEHLIIVGATVDGIILSQVAIYYQAVPIIIDMREDLLAIAQKAGAYYTINAVNEDITKKVQSITGGHMADASAFMLNSSMPVQNIFDITANGGRIALVGMLNNCDLKCNLSQFVDKKHSLTTVTDCGKNYPSAINMLANRTVAVDSLYSEITKFADVPDAFERFAADPNVPLKHLIKI